MQVQVKLAAATTAAAMLLPALGSAEPPPEPGPDESTKSESEEAPRAAQPQPEQTRALRTEATEVRVIGNRADALQRVPGSGDLVTRQQIDRAQPADAAEMLRRVPGVQARQEY